MAEACREEAILGNEVGERVRLKWPNDLYAVIGAGNTDRKKIGGILVNTSFTGNQVDIVIGQCIAVFVVEDTHSNSFIYSQVVD